MTRTPFRTFTNDKGRTFAVRYLPEGARYGRTNALTTDRPTDRGVLQHHQRRRLPA